MFIDPEPDQLEASYNVGAPVVELHTGAFCEAEPEGQAAELERLHLGAATAERLGLECHAGHGISYDTVAAIAAIPTIVELNIGHFMIGESIYTGIERSVQRMRALMDEARAGVSTTEET